MINEQTISEMLGYVEEQLKTSKIQTKRRPFPFRTRFEHTKRVVKWAERLLESEAADRDVVLTAAVFHDVGYARCETSEDARNHAAHSAVMTREYLTERGYDGAFTEAVCDAIANHSKKELLRVVDTPPEVVLLQEADLLDETGALAVVWDCMAEGGEEVQTFPKTLEHLKAVSLQTIRTEPMRTETARKFWAEKRALTEAFVASLEFDLQT